MTRLGVRWTIGDVSAYGFDVLRLSIWGAHRIFGERARYVVSVNTIDLGEARRRTGELPAGIEWRQVTRDDVPAWALARVDGAMAQGVFWKLAPLTIFPGMHELALDNDCVLFDMPDAMARWLDDDRSCLIAADVRSCFGRFAALSGDEPRNSGIRGTPPGFDLAGALRRTLASVSGTLDSELDEQGLQVAALTRACLTHVVGTDDVSICSPFPPHQHNLGRCGAHFVGLNARSLGWTYEGRAGEQYVREHFDRQRTRLEALVRPSTEPRSATR